MYQAIKSNNAVYLALGQSEIRRSSLPWGICGQPLNAGGRDHEGIGY